MITKMQNAEFRIQKADRACVWYLHSVFEF
jgi:hypothetical protein